MLRYCYLFFRSSQNGAITLYPQTVAGYLTALEESFYWKPRDQANKTPQCGWLALGAYDI